MPNHLKHESSPYLLQHVDNPVDWYPWGEEALRLAKESDKPILLSVGYAACHWCHVMAHESFEDDATAAQMNADFINVKVDREERPDVDSIYMQAVTAMTGRGGWPMTVFLTPDAKPFYAGTYFPDEPRHGMPSFRQILTGVAQAWTTDRESVLKSAGDVAQQLQALSGIAHEAQPVDQSVLSSALRAVGQRFDPDWGGFGGAPKFPQPMTMELLLREWLRAGDAHALQMAELTLKRMAMGGMYDQLGGGFARYSVDHRWLVPHFEKMLYDNALLSRVYVHAWQVTGNPLYRRIAEETLDYLLREMRDEGGGFYSSQDADSEGVEGKFYVWSAEEIRSVLGDDAETFMRLYGVSDEGNWEGHNVLNLHLDPNALAGELGIEPEVLDTTIARARGALLEARSKRVRPGLDDKVLTAWNGLALGALADAGRAFGRTDYLDAAVSNAEFLRRAMRRRDGRLYRTWKAGSEAKYNGYLEDYACLADGLLALYAATFDPAWADWARELADAMVTHFVDADGAGFFDTSDDHETLIHRPKDLQDNATPSGNAMAAGVLLKLSLLTGEGRLWDIAEKSIASTTRPMSQYPTGFAQWLSLASFLVAEPREVAIVGSAAQRAPLVEVVDRRYRPFVVVAAGDEADDAHVALLEGRTKVAGNAAAYVCRRFVCEAPVTEAAALEQALDAR